MLCLLDLDGVLVDFVKAAHEFHNIPYSENNYPYDLGNYGNCPSKSSGMSDEDFWTFDEDFWINMQWMSRGKDLVKFCEDLFGQSNVCLLTKPTQPVSCSGKFKWIQKNLPQYSSQFLIGPGKHFCAHSDAVLVDDSDENIKKFNSYRGKGVLVPRPWNSDYGFRHISYATTINRIKTQFIQRP